MKTKLAFVVFLFFSTKAYTDQIGYASWYGGKHHGKKTASGELFDMNKLTAASKTIAFGTKVKVTNLSNNKSVVVTINDRGPYIKGRIIDLSKKAAIEIDLIKRGHSKVKIEKI